MALYFSKSARGFYLEGDTMPSDAKPIDTSVHDYLITQNHIGGKVIDWSGDFPTLKDPDPVSGEAFVKLVEDEVQRYLDSKASERGYDNIHSAALRASIPNSPFRAEGVAYAQWMDACWASCYVLLNKVKRGEIPAPTVLDVLNQLPTLTLPDTVF